MAIPENERTYHHTLSAESIRQNLGQVEEGNWYVADTIEYVEGEDEDDDANSHATVEYSCFWLVAEIMVPIDCHQHRERTGS